MKVNLATQALSKSVADALEYCNIHLKIKTFEGCEATVKFIRIIDQLFDVLNARNPIGRGKKVPLCSHNRNVWGPFIDEAFQYLLHLKESTLSGKYMHKSKRKTGFVGFMTGIKSIRGIFDEYVSTDGSPLKYLLTYKMSQDHLELFFGAVRAAGRCNNNPTVQHFVAAYKRLLLHSCIGIISIRKRPKVSI